MESPDRMSSSDAPFLDESEKDIESLPWHGFLAKGRDKKATSRSWQRWTLMILLLTVYSAALLFLAGVWKGQTAGPFLTYSTSLC